MDTNKQLGFVDEVPVKLWSDPEGTTKLTLSLGQRRNGEYRAYGTMSCPKNTWGGANDCVGRGSSALGAIRAYFDNARRLWSCWPFLARAEMEMVDTVEVLCWTNEPTAASKRANER